MRAYGRRYICGCCNEYKADRSRERDVAKRDVTESLEALAEVAADDEELLLSRRVCCADWREHEIEAMLAHLAGEPIP